MKTVSTFSTIVAFLWIVATAVANDDPFSCHAAAFMRLSKDNERGAIYPRADINVKVGEDSKTVLCRFNDAFIKSEHVFFKGLYNRVLPHKVVNSSTIEVKIMHHEPAKYLLQCVRRRTKGEKVLCKQFVKAGYPPLDIANNSLQCISKNYVTLNCTWQYEDNPISTTWTPQYSVPKFSNENSCLTNNVKTSCYWKDIHSLRDKIYLHMHGKNVLGEREYTHVVNIAEVVIPDKISTTATLIGPKTVRISWNLKYPIDVFFSGLWHKVDYRLAGEVEWEDVTLISHKHPIKQMTIKRQFHVTKELPLANMEYEFRVRLHTMGAPTEEKQLWSDYNIISIRSEAMLPTHTPKTDLSSFEVVEYLDKRDIYVNFRDIYEKFYNGNNFTYKIEAYSSSSNKTLEVLPTDRWPAYIKYPVMDFNETRFKIWPQNEKGLGKVYSEVIVPSYACMPKKTDFFTVIIRDRGLPNHGGSKIFSLYWVPSKKSENHCPGSSSNIDYYTIFWCKNTYASRCKERLFWTNVNELHLVQPGFNTLSGENNSLYEKNITNLKDDLYTFGIAAVSGNYSSGIRWSRCNVDENDSPPAPTNVNAYTKDSNTVRLKWELKCPSLSAVPLGFKVVYCKSKIPDFGKCESKVESVIVNKPNALGYTLDKGLQAGVSYIVSVLLLSYVGDGRQSVPVMFTILEKEPSGAPLSFQSSNVGNSSATLSWFKPKPFLRNGKITRFCLSCFHCDIDVFGVNNCVSAGDETTHVYNLENLSPFTEYGIRIAACTKKGCSDFSASITFKTKTAVPEPVRNFLLDVSNWRLQWDEGSCHSRKCTFDIKIPVNDTFMYEETVENANYLNLNDLDLPCLAQEMEFFIRPIGLSENDKAIYGEWTPTYKTANECPSDFPSTWWMICILIIAAIIIMGIVLVSLFGWKKISQVIKAYKMKIDVPTGILEDTIKERKNEHKKKFLNEKRDGLLAMPQKTGPVVLPVCPLQEAIHTDEKAWVRTPRTSVSSEEVQLIPSNGDSHGRNLSAGDSELSSNQDSAMMSQSSSTVESDSPTAQNALRPGISDFTYVRHGILPDKIPEGYVAARSVPSLPILLKSGESDVLVSTPNLNGYVGPEMVWARRASTGYISMVNSDTGKLSPSQMDSTVLESNSSPSYTKDDTYPSHEIPMASNYVTLAEIPPIFRTKNGYVLHDQEVPRVEENTTNPPYVAVGDPTFLPPTNIPPYVQLSDANRWTAPQKVSVNTREKDLINEMTPSLSKQSSGYVSQEGLAQEKQVVVSPKRLVAQGRRPQSVGFPISNHQSSMV